MRLIVLIAALALLPAAPPVEAGRAALSTSACPCGRAKVCTGKRGGRYCIAPSGARRYVR